MLSVLGSVVGILAIYDFSCFEFIRFVFVWSIFFFFVFVGPLAAGAGYEDAGRVEEAGRGGVVWGCLVWYVSVCLGAVVCLSV